MDLKRILTAGSHDYFKKFTFLCFHRLAITSLVSLPDFNPNERKSISM